MSDPSENESPQRLEPDDLGLLATSLNILTSPSEAFAAIKHRPSKAFPLLLVVVLNALVLTWYFNIVDYEWFVDDILSAGTISEEERAEARESMLALSINSFALFGVIGGSAAIIVINLLQAAYLSLVAAIRGDRFKFSHWFSLVCWAGFPVLLTIAGSAVTILLTPNGQLSSYQLDPLTLYNLGLGSNSASVQALTQSISLTAFWSLGLIAIGHQQWTQASWARSVIIVTSPYLCILGIWGFFAFS